MINSGRPSSEFPRAGKAPFIAPFALRWRELARRFSAAVRGTGWSR